MERAKTASEGPSVRIHYSSLPRKSKRKLKELLDLWSEWHAQNCSSAEDLQEELDYGEETYFPAVPVGPDKSTTMLSLNSKIPRMVGIRMTIGLEMISLFECA